MYYKFTVSRTDFNFEEYFACARPPTKHQLISYYTSPSRRFGASADIMQVVIYLLKHPECAFPHLRKETSVGFSFDGANHKYNFILSKIDVIPLSAKEGLNDEQT